MILKARRRPRPLAGLHSSHSCKIAKPRKADYQSPAANRAGRGGNVLLSFLFGRRPRRPDLSIVLYTRRGCHLCDTAWQVLKRARRQYGFALAAVDVDTSDELRTRHGASVPVVTVNGRVRFRGGVNAVLLQRILDAGLPVSVLDRQPASGRRLTGPSPP